MKKKFLSENDLELHEVFGIILSIESFSDYVNEIVELVFNNTLDKKHLEEILKKYKIKKLDDIKEELLDVLIVYINLILMKLMIFLTDNFLGCIEMMIK